MSRFKIGDLVVYKKHEISADESYFEIGKVYTVTELSYDVDAVRLDEIDIWADQDQIELVRRKSTTELSENEEEYPQVETTLVVTLDLGKGMRLDYTKEQAQQLYNKLGEIL